MSIEDKDEFLNMALTPWERNALVDENYGVVGRENAATIPLCWDSNNIDNNGEEDQSHLVKSGDDDQLELFSNEMVIGSLVEAAALLGLEDDDNNIINYGEIGGSSNNNINININGDIIIEASNNAKKEEHNAKERERRMKLSQTFFSLRSLLPNARRTKKRWSTATIIDKVVDYIPTLQKEIENLNQKKHNLIKAKETNNNDQRVIIAHENQGLGLFDHNHIPTVSIHQLCKGEQVIIQICINQTNILKLSTLIHKAQAQGLRIIGASVVSVSVPLSNDRPTLTCHLHLQVDRSLQEAANFESILRKRVISWLC